MIKMDSFDLSLVGKNLQTFKGAFKYLDDFLTQTELLHDLIKEEDGPIFIKYVYNFKITTFIDLKKGLDSTYPSIAEFREKIAGLSDQLSSFEIANLANPPQEAKDVVYKVSDSISVYTFI